MVVTVKYWQGIRFVFPSEEVLCKTHFMWCVKINIHAAGKTNIKVTILRQLQANTVRRRTAKYSCRDTTAVIVFDYMHKEFVKRGKQQSHESVTNCSI